MSLTATPERIAQFLVNSEAPVSTHIVTQDRVVLRDIILCSVDDSLRNYISLAIVPDGETLSDKHYIQRKLLIRAGESINLSDFRIVLSSGDRIYMSTSSGAVSVYLSGGAYVEVV